MAKGKKQIPEELQGVATIEDVSAVEEKLEKCYSRERYEEFQEAVEKIVLRTI